ncbi:cationic amino acid transporter 4 [Lingula anatina]|uniref:Cationic amino acid transporter 4 n=1 Tax=Lingula anatina TaxID=7574 RepID=A0A1S3K3P8_LINAN|nr:cationic amino acid transporter 4 [Lingula anatina]|eukprot:XP_013416886.1 cationic amino acid transporter 4 [Lingula anatina]
MKAIENLCANFMRVKRLDHDLLTTPLLRCLSTMELYFFGLGCMMAVGVYVLNGSIVSYDAGPAACVSFLIAGVAASMSALCYAEFAARIPKAGSAYIYCYTTIGEFWAFIVGWNIILEYLLGVAVLARGWSSVIRHFIWGSNDVWKFMYSSPDLSKSKVFLTHPDYFAFGVILLTALVLVSGAKPSIRLSSMMTAVNLSIILFTTILSYCYGDIKNLTQSRDGLPYLPKGVEGVLNGAAKAFFAYIGFDCIAIAAEEAKNPAYSVPRAILAALGTILLVYFGTSTALASLLPYKLIDPASAFPAALAVNGLPWARYMVLVGSLFGLSTAISGQMFSLPRVIFAMACDGLFFKVFRRVGTWAHIPSLALLASIPVPAILALVMETETLIHFLSLGTLIAYTSVSASVLLFRYQPLSVADVATLQDYGLLSPKRPSSSGTRKQKTARLRGEDEHQSSLLEPGHEATIHKDTKPEHVVSHLDGAIKDDAVSDTDTAMSSETASTVTTVELNSVKDTKEVPREDDKETLKWDYDTQEPETDQDDPCEVPRKADVASSEATTDKPRRKPKKPLDSLKHIGALRSKFTKIPILKSCKPGLAVVCAVILHLVFSGSLAGTLLYMRDDQWRYDWMAILMIAVSVLGIISCHVTMVVHRRNDKFKTFKVPLVPLIPSFSMLINVVLMLQLSYITWLKMAVWVILGVIIYFGYGMQHSDEAQRPDVPFPYNLLETHSGVSYSSLGQTLMLQQPPNKYQSGHSHVDKDQGLTESDSIDDIYDNIQGPEEPILPRVER